MLKMQKTAQNPGGGMKSVRISSFNGRALFQEVQKYGTQKKANMAMDNHNIL